MHPKQAAGTTFVHTPGHFVRLMCLLCDGPSRSFCCVRSVQVIAAAPVLAWGGGGQGGTKNHRNAE